MLFILFCICAVYITITKNFIKTKNVYTDFHTIWHVLLPDQLLLSDKGTELWQKTWFCEIAEKKNRNGWCDASLNRQFRKELQWKNAEIWAVTRRGGMVKDVFLNGRNCIQNCFCMLMGMIQQRCKNWLWLRLLFNRLYSFCFVTTQSHSHSAHCLGKWPPK